MELKTYPDPCLRIKTNIVEIFDQDLKDILKVMSDIMYLSNGIGLAATQIGLGLNIFLVDVGEGLIHFINPEILESSKQKTVMEEGCLSLPGIQVRVHRPDEVKIRAQNETGDFFIKKFSGIGARAIQHEYDHLRGKLIIDYLNPIRLFLAKRKLANLTNRENKNTCEVMCNDGRKDNGDIKRST